MAGFTLGTKASARGYRLFGFDTVGSTSIEASRAAQAGDVGDVWFAALQQTEGRVSIPYLYDPNTEQGLFESADILDYLRETYGN